MSKSTFPESASTNEWARFLYYTGIIKAIQLDYSEAHKNLLQAIRKAPQHAAYGFKQTVSDILLFWRELHRQGVKNSVHSSETSYFVCGTSVSLCLLVQRTSKHLGHNSYTYKFFWTSHKTHLFFQFFPTCLKDK